ncbi:helix-turn-helix domain-containing protein [Saccharobesus litoralis]|uniref:helix-turn-helix domain-containing protein n=1 Tax=Saccharobesus litoralis TaxID=2172099 RepID=UPI00131F2521|nr:helix-turn-helix domain-containing protein [Saccharobesus litoralis]
MLESDVRTIATINTRLNQALNWAQDNLHLGVTTDDLAQQAYLTRSTFDRHFRQTMQTSPHVWLTAIKLEKAKALLISSQLTIETIAKSCGYISALSLRISFKKQLGITPGQFRKQHCA